MAASASDAGNTSPEPGVEVFVCGRLCLFGEHSDWAGGYRTQCPSIAPGRTIIVGMSTRSWCISAASVRSMNGTQEGLHATVRRLDQPVLLVTTTSSDGQRHGPHELPLDTQALLAEAQAGGFWSYIAGTALRIATAHHVGGLHIDNHTTTLPMGKGLSSSAAICVLVARAFNLVYGLKLTTRGEMEFAYLGEVTTPSKCGRMDQACAFGSIPVAMTFDGDLLHTEPVQLNGTLYLVLVDLCAAKDTTTILTSLQKAYPIPAGGDHLLLHNLLGPYNESVTRRALEAMVAGDVPVLGLLMTEAQARFDAAAGPLCPSQLTAPVLHRVLTCPELQPLIWGAKGVGSQGDGTAQLLCRGPTEQEEASRILTSAFKMSCMKLTVAPSSTAP